ncbi:MAG TPA: T9SS type A sorting domain-containing protein, partial [Bacteroidetes bacterium]|nr:T9SS type A sorting domain-containing protein [Bacteroidota bacterium]HEX03973.1 T9SS type A sorting domain-containing protein [Bacteroidota bacterium]
QIPGYAPTGSYDYIGNVGYFPGTILVSDSFEMVKLGGNSNRSLSDSDLAAWSGTGFDEVITGDAASRSEIPVEFAMSEAYPNPFNPTTSMVVSLPEAVDLTVQVFNLNGRLVATLSEGRVEAGNHTLTFDGSDLSSGMYFVTASVPGDMNMTHKLVLMK